MNGRPEIFSYQDPEQLVSDMVRYRRETESSFSVANVCAGLEELSPSLVTLIIKRKRKITKQKVTPLARLMGLKGSEIRHFRSLVSRSYSAKSTSPTKQNVKKTSPKRQRRKKVSYQLLNDPVNVLVKDAFGIKEVSESKELIFTVLAGVASPERIMSSIEYLVKHGYLEETHLGFSPTHHLSVADENIASERVREFHKFILKNAKEAIDLYDMDKRLANAMTMSLTDDEYQELSDLIRGFSQELQAFASNQSRSKGRKLYQLAINLCPTGGKI